MNQMKVKVSINKAVFSDGNEVEFDNNGITVFVGPNNAGKSASLKEMHSLLKNASQETKVVKKIVMSKVGTNAELLGFLDEISKKQESGNAKANYAGFGFNVYPDNASSWWNNSLNNGLSELIGVFSNLLTTEVRLTAANPAQNISITTQPLTHPIHFLQTNDELEKQFSIYFRQAFGTDLIVHRNAGNEVPLYIGNKPAINSGEDRVSKSYLERLELLPKLQEQGDGMRSFVGVLLNAFISYYSILFIDEPEAFLHPPQAKLLGKMLSKDLPSEKQLFLSTHSMEFLMGILDGNVDNIRIIRIQRDGDINKISSLNKSDIITLWNDPLLRHSNILEGLFHSKVVICESDSDCRFYSAILDSIVDDDSTAVPDVMFIQCGGKHRIHSVVRALRKLNVPLSVVCDFDVLNNENPLKNIIEELGGGWSGIESDWKLIKGQIEQKKPELNTADVKKEIGKALDEISDKNFPRKSAQNIMQILNKSSAWAYAKQVGRSFIPSGDATRAAERLFDNLKSINCFVLEVGELECFVRSVGNHGPKWVNEVLKKDLRNDPQLELARNFVKQIIK